MLKKKKHYSIAFILILFCCKTSFSQIINLDSLFQVFKNDVLIEQNEHEGIIIFDNDTRLSFYSFMNYAKINDIVKYVEDDNPFIRAYIFKSLIDKNASSEVISNAMLLLENDSSLFRIQSADLVTSYQVNGFANLMLENKNSLRKINYEEEIEMFKARYPFSIKLEGVRHNQIKKEQLLSLDSLTTLDDSFKIVAFDIIINDLEFSHNSSVLSRDVKNAFGKLKAEDKVTFDNIQVVTPENARIIPASFQLKIQ